MPFGHLLNALATFITTASDWVEVEGTCGDTKVKVHKNSSATLEKVKVYVKNRGNCKIVFDPPIANADDWNGTGNETFSQTIDVPVGVTIYLKCGPQIGQDRRPVCKFYWKVL